MVFWGSNEWWCAICANLINVFRLLANQQEDGDCLFHNIVKNLGKENRESFTDSLREFIQIDNNAPLKLDT